MSQSPHKAYTLIEVLVVIFIISLVSTLGGILLMKSVNSMRISTAETELRSLEMLRAKLSVMYVSTVDATQPTNNNYLLHNENISIDFSSAGIITETTTNFKYFRRIGFNLDTIGQRILSAKSAGATELNGVPIMFNETSPFRLQFVQGTGWSIVNI